MMTEIGLALAITVLSAGNLLLICRVLNHLDASRHGYEDRMGELSRVLERFTERSMGNPHLAMLHSNERMKEAPTGQTPPVPVQYGGEDFLDSGIADSPDGPPGGAYTLMR